MKRAQSRDPQSGPKVETEVQPARPIGRELGTQADDSDERDRLRCQVDALSGVNIACVTPGVAPKALR